MTNSPSANTAASIPQIFDKGQRTDIPIQNAFIIIASFICFLGINNKSPEITIIGILLMLDIFLSLDYGQFNFSNLSPLFGLIPMLSRTSNIPQPTTTYSNIIVDRVEM